MTNRKTVLPEYIACTNTSLTQRKALLSFLKSIGLPLPKIEYREILKGSNLPHVVDIREPECAHLHTLQDVNDSDCFRNSGSIQDVIFTFVPDGIKYCYYSEATDDLLYSHMRIPLSELQPRQSLVASR